MDLRHFAIVLVCVVSSIFADGATKSPLCNKYPPLVGFEIDRVSGFTLEKLGSVSNYADFVFSDSSTSEDGGRWKKPQHSQSFQENVGPRSITEMLLIQRKSN